MYCILSHCVVIAPCAILVIALSLHHCVIFSLRHYDVVVSLRCHCVIAFSMRHFCHCVVIASLRHFGIAVSLRHGAVIAALRYHCVILFLSMSCHCVLPLLVRYCVIIASSFHCVVISSLRQFALRLGSPRAHFTQCLAEAGQNQRDRTEKSAARKSVARMPGGLIAFLLRNTPIYRAALRAAGGQLIDWLRPH